MLQWEQVCGNPKSLCCIISYMRGIEWGQPCALWEFGYLKKPAVRLLRKFVLLIMMFQLFPVFRVSSECLLLKQQIQESQNQRTRRME